MAKKSKSFNKHVYSLIAVIVLLVAAGIASYAVAPAGAASHGTLYTDIIQGKTGESVTVGNENRLLLVSAITPMPNGLININDRSDTEGSIGVKVDSSRGGTGIEVIY